MISCTHVFDVRYELLGVDSSVGVWGQTHSHWRHLHATGLARIAQFCFRVVAITSNVALLTLSTATLWSLVVDHRFLAWRHSFVYPSCVVRTDIGWCRYYMMYSSYLASPAHGVNTVTPRFTFWCSKQIQVRARAVNARPDQTPAVDRFDKLPHLTWSYDSYLTLNTRAANSMISA